MKKIFSTKQHAINDYLLAGTLLLAPSLLGLNKKAGRTYRMLAANLATYNAITDYEGGIKPVISVEAHKKVDVANLATLYMLPLYKGIRKDRRALGFHLAVTAIATLNVLLTDWEK